MSTAVVLKSGAIVIRVSPSELKRAAEQCPELEQHDDKGALRPKIRDVKAFAKEVAASLNAEDGESGLTRVQKLFDECFVEAVEWGAEGVSMPDYDDYGPKRYL